MKKLLKLLSILAISTPIPLTVVACEPGEKSLLTFTPTNKIDLKTKITTLTGDITADTNNTNQNLDIAIKNTIKLTNLNPKIQYFSDEHGTIDITNEKQTSGDLYVVITADTNDKNYQGSTNPIKISLKARGAKIGLNTITQLSGLEITANPSKKYKELISDINNSNEFKSKPLANGYQLQFYDENDKEITNDNQKLENISKIKVKIISSLDDQNYQGSTNNIDITNQTAISDDDMQSYFAKITLPWASWAPKQSTNATTNQEKAIEDIINQLKQLQKTTEPIVKALLSGMYKEKIDFNKLRNENEIYDENQKPVSNHWFENKQKNKKANVLIFYGSTKKGYFYPITININ